MSPLLIDALTISDGRFKKKCSASVFKMMLLNEEMNRIPGGAPQLSRRVYNPMRSRSEFIICQALQHISNVDNNLFW